MSSQFLRVYRKSEDKEILINLGMVWKIEVTYVVRDGDTYFSTVLDHGLKNPEAIRVYDIYAGSEKVRLVADDPGAKVFDDIYKAAIKG